MYNVTTDNLIASEAADGTNLIAFNASTERRSRALSNAIMRDPIHGSVSWCIALLGDVNGGLSAGSHPGSVGFMLQPLGLPFPPGSFLARQQADATS